MTIKPIKLIALDMDGTTLRRDGSLSQENRTAMEDALAQGVHVVFATGRTREALPQNVKAVEGMRYAITSNGAAVADLKEDRWLYKNEIKGESIPAVLNALSGSGLFIEAFVDGRAYMDESWTERIKYYGLPEDYTQYALITRHPIPNLFGFLAKQKGIENINVNFGDPELRKQYESRLRAIPGTALTTSFPHNWELGALTVSKADGLRALCEYLGVKREETMAIGDNENDRAMLGFAGCSVAMGNASASLQAAAGYVTASCEEDGVAKAIRKFVL